MEVGQGIAGGACFALARSPDSWRGTTSFALIVAAILVTMALVMTLATQSSAATNVVSEQPALPSREVTPDVVSINRLEPLAPATAQPVTSDQPAGHQIRQSYTPRRAPVRPEAILLGDEWVPLTRTTRSLSRENDQLRWQWLVPAQGAGYHEDSAPFGAGITIVVGHSVLDGQPGSFIDLPHLTPGAIVTGRNSDGREWYYEIVATETRAYEDGSWLEHPLVPANALVVYTCDPQLTHLFVAYATPLPEREDIQ
jgi:hypothetical protein